MSGVLSQARHWTALVLAGMVTAAWSIGLAPAAEPSAETAVRAVWLAIDETFNARDAERFSKLFTEDASFVRVKRKEALEGRTAIYEEFARRFPGFSPDVRHRTTIGQVTAIAPGILAADGKVEILRVTPEASANPAVLYTYAIFAVMTQQPEGLRVRTLRVYELPKEAEAADRSAAATTPVSPQAGLATSIQLRQPTKGDGGNYDTLRNL